MGQPPPTETTPLMSDQASNIPTPISPDDFSTILQTSPFLLVPGEIRNMIYNAFLETRPVTDDDTLFSEAHNLGSTCRQLRTEFWAYFLSHVILTKELQFYEEVFKAFYPCAAPEVMNNYVGRFDFTMGFRGATYTSSVDRPAGLETIDLKTLVMVLRASPRVQFTLDAMSRWMCRRTYLKAFLDYVRVSPTWVVTPVIESLRLRVREAQMGDSLGMPTFWIIDVGLKRDLRHVYEQIGLLAYLEQRTSEGREGITFYVTWDREEVKVPGKKEKSWFLMVKSCIMKGLRKGLRALGIS